MKSIRQQIDLLAALKLPDRYEPLYNLVGDQLANILVAPPESVRDQLVAIVDSIRSGEQGTLVPLAGESGAGKTTFAASVTQWEATSFTPTIQYAGDIKFDDLAEVVAKFRNLLPANDRRVIPINVDHRESSPLNYGRASCYKAVFADVSRGSPGRNLLA